MGSEYRHSVEKVTCYSTIVCVCVCVFVNGADDGETNCTLTFALTAGHMLSGGASAVIHYNATASGLETLSMSPRDASAAVHSPLQLPSTTFLNNHISKSVALQSFPLFTSFFKIFYSVFLSKRFLS